MSVNNAEIFSKHIVGFSWLNVPKGKDDKIPPRLHCLTGFVVSVKGHWFLAMAGHCMKEFDELVRSGKRNVGEVSLIDDILVNKVAVRIPFSGIPLAERTEPDWHYYVNDAEGVDCGFLRLREYYVNLLKTTGIEPIDIRSISYEDNESFEDYAVEGFPSESINLKISANSIRSPIGLVYVPLQKIPAAEIPSYYPEQSLDDVGRYYTEHYRIINIGSVSDFDGISGGPVFGFTKHPEGGHNYKLVGLQTGWKRDQQRVFTTPAVKCGTVLLALLKRWGISIK